MSENVHIREMAVNDYDDVMALWQSVEGVGLGPSDSRENIAGYLARNPRMSFVALDGPAIVGTVICGTDGRRGYLGHLAVLPSHRKLGIASELVVRCLAALKAIGIHRCNLSVFADNADAIAFWRKIGWRFWEERGIKAMSRDIE